ncbi:MAG: hypothetical protein ABR958_04985 [Dehalococcoidales bacterium]
MNTTIPVLDFVKGIMTTSAAFITIAGILFAFGFRKKNFDEFSGWETFSCLFLLFSILVGAGVIGSSLFWLNSPANAPLNIAKYFLIGQFATLYIPIICLIVRLGIKAKN